MNKEPETYEELIRKKRCIDLTKYYELSQQDLDKIYTFLENNPDGQVRAGTQNISLIKGNDTANATVIVAKCISAAIDDGLLDIQFRVVGFETTFFDNMSNVIPEISRSGIFTDRQRDMMRRLNRGKRFYISRVHAIGPDGIERTLQTSMEVIIN